MDGRDGHGDGAGRVALFDDLPGFFQFTHNIRRRGRGLLQPMLTALLTSAV